MPPTCRGHFSFQDMQLSDCYKIGYILKPHGLKGEVTLSLSPEGPDDLSSIKTVFVEQHDRLVPFFIEVCSQNGDKAFVKFEEVDSSDAANAISKSSVYLPKSERPKSGRGEFYDDEIIGFQVHDKELGHLGDVQSIEKAGPNKLIVINYHDKEVLIPVNGPFITGINKSKKRIAVELPEGFLDI
jgi:16S rRNA processing protein RimM